MTAVYCALIHYPVRDRSGASVATSVTNIDVHDIARSAQTYGLRRYFIVTPISAQRPIIDKITEHWKTGSGAKRIPERSRAIELVQPVETVEAAIQWIEEQHGKPPAVWATSADKQSKETISYAEARQRLEEDDRPVLLLFGTGHGLAQSLVNSTDALLPPIAAHSDFNHLSVRAAVAITLDRLYSSP